MMHEEVCAVIIGRDEPITFGIVEPLDGACLHDAPAPYV
jgi:hypothetical protein